MACIVRKEEKFAKVFPWKWILNSDRSFRLWTTPIILLIVSAISFGLYANKQGFYWDDWGIAWAGFFQGLMGLKATFSANDALRAYVDAALLSFFGINPFVWQILAILMRWLAAVTLWWLLRLVWPKYPRPVFMVTLLFLVYPGFSQQAIALTYYYLWFLLVILFSSLGLMLWAVRTTKYFWPAMIVALLLSALHLFLCQYFFGVELLRILFLWLVLGSIIPNPKKRLKHTLIYYAPFALVLMVFLFWRVFIFKFPGYQPYLLYSFQSSPLQGLIGLIKTMGQTIYTVSLQAWTKVIQIPNVDKGGSRFSTFYPWIIISCLIGLIFYQDRLAIQTPSQQEKPDRKYVWQFFGIGLMGILLAGIPYYLTKLPVRATFPEDRFTLAFALGVSFLLVFVIEMLLKPSYSITFVSVLVTLAVGLHFYTSFLYRNENEVQRIFLWQTTWRVPAFRENTLILSDDTTFPYTDDEGLSFALNWTYSPENHTNRLPYLFLNISSRLGAGKSLPSLEKDVPVNKNFILSAIFSGSTDKAVVIYFSPPSCLRILNPIYDADFVSLPVIWENSGKPTIQDVRFLPKNTRKALPLSNMDSILPDPGHAAKPPAFIFSNEPKHDWCYIFEKADLARQIGNWDEAARLGDEAAGNSFYPGDLSEYLVFIESYAHVQRWQDAQAYSEKVAGWAPDLRPALCGIWQRAELFENNTDSTRALISSVKRELYCLIP